MPSGAKQLRSNYHIYKIDSRIGSESYSTIVSNTQSTATHFIHEGLDDSERYSYKVYAINSDGTSAASSVATAEPGETLAPSGLTATAISPSQIKLQWLPPSNTFGQPITSYTIERVVAPGVYEEIANVGRDTEYTVTSLQTGKTSEVLHSVGGLILGIGIQTHVPDHSTAMTQLYRL